MSTPAGSDARSSGRMFVDAPDDVDDVRARLAPDVEYQGRRRVHPAAQLRVLGALCEGRDVAQAHRRIVPVGDDEVRVIGGALQLIVGVDRVRARRPVERALRAVLVRDVYRRPQIVEIEPVRGERARIDDDPDRGTLAAADADDADPLELRNLLGDARVGEILDLRQRHDLRGDAERQYRRVRGVHFRVDRRRGQILRQEVLRCADRRLDLLLGDVDRERQVELQCDDGGAGGTRRRHLREARHLAELLLEGRRDRRGDDVGARAGVERLHLDGRVGDLGQRRQRQREIRHEADREDRRHQQRRRDRALDEEARRIHAGAGRRLAGGRIVTFPARAARRAIARPHRRAAGRRPR